MLLALSLHTETKVQGTGVLQRSRAQATDVNPKLLQGVIIGGSWVVISRLRSPLI